MITRYHTKSGSVYAVRTVDGVTEVYRTKLGEKHGEDGRVRRAADKLDEWRVVDDFTSHGLHFPAIITLSRKDDRVIYTSPVVSIEVT